MPDWRAIQCQAQHEHLVHRGLAEIGIPCWFPYRMQRRWQHGRRIRHKVGYFPGYVFADVEGVHPVAITAVKGVERILGEVPIPKPVIKELKARAEPDGFIADPPLKPGDLVNLPVGLTGKITNVDKSYVRVLIQSLFGRWCVCAIPATQV